MTNKRSWFVFIYVLFILFCFYPYEFFSTYLLFVPDQATYFSAVLIALTGVIMLIGKKGYYTQAVIKVAVMQLLGFIMTGLVHGSLGSVSNSFVRMVLALLLVMLIENSSGGLLGFFKKYNRWILVMAMLGSITWGLATFAGFQPLSFFIDRAGGLTMYNYGLTFTKTDLTYTGMIRYAGFFDEPGAMAYWGMYALLINKIFIKERRLELFLIICLLLTFSLGFYFQLLVYLILFSLGKSRKSTWLVWAVVGILAVITISSLSEDSVIYEKSFGRILETYSESQETGSIFMTGNRAEYTENAKRQFLENPIFGTKSDELAIGNNIYENLARYGILGCFFILFPYLYIFILSIKNRDWELLKCGIVILLGFSHRPFHNALLYYFIIYSIIAMYMASRRKVLQPTH